MDANCKHELNSQLQGLEARIRQCEQNDTSMFLGMSAVVAAAVSQVPALATIAATMFNGLPTGFQTLVGLISSVSPEQFLAIGLRMALQKLGTPSIAGLLNNVNSLVMAEVQQKEQELLTAINTSQPAQQIQNLRDELSTLQNHVDTLNGFLASQQNITVCKIATQLIG